MRKFVNGDNFLWNSLSKIMKQESMLYVKTWPSVSRRAVGSEISCVMIALSFKLQTLADDGHNRERSARRSFFWKACSLLRYWWCICYDTCMAFPSKSCPEQHVIAAVISQFLPWCYYECTFCYLANRPGGRRRMRSTVLAMLRCLLLQAVGYSRVFCNPVRLYCSSSAIQVMLLASCRRQLYANSLDGCVLLQIFFMKRQAHIIRQLPYKLSNCIFGAVVANSLQRATLHEPISCGLHGIAPKRTRPDPTEHRRRYFP